MSSLIDIGTPGSATYSQQLENIYAMLDALADNTVNDITAKDVRDVVFTLHEEILNQVSPTSFEIKTWALWSLVKNSSQLTQGDNVMISDRADIGIIIQCSDVNEFNNYASGGFLNCDYLNIGNDISADINYSNIVNYTGVTPSYNRGIYDPSLLTISYRPMNYLISATEISQMMVPRQSITFTNPDMSTVFGTLIEDDGGGNIWILCTDIVQDGATYSGTDGSGTVITSSQQIYSSYITSYSYTQMTGIGQLVYFTNPDLTTAVANLVGDDGNGNIYVFRLFGIIKAGAYYYGNTDGDGYVSTSSPQSLSPDPDSILKNADSSTLANIVSDDGVGTILIEEFADDTNLNGNDYFGNVIYSGSRLEYQSDATMMALVLSTLPSISLSDGDIWIWENSNYQVINSSLDNGTSPDNNPAFMAIPKISPYYSGIGMGYVPTWNRIDYDFENDLIIKRYDSLGNIVPNSSLNTFQFGDPNITNCIIEGGGIVNNLNNHGIIEQNNYGDAPGRSVIHYGNKGRIKNCNFGKGVTYRVVINSYVTVERCNFLNTLSDTRINQSINLYDKTHSNLNSDIETQMYPTKNLSYHPASQNDIIFNSTTPTGGNLSLPNKYSGSYKIMDQILSIMISSDASGYLQSGETVTFTNPDLTTVAAIAWYTFIPNSYLFNYFINQYGIGSIYPVDTSAYCFSVRDMYQTFGNDVIQAGATFVGSDSGVTGTLDAFFGGGISSVSNSAYPYPYILYPDINLSIPILINKDQRNDAIFSFFGGIFGSAIYPMISTSGDLNKSLSTLLQNNYNGNGVNRFSFSNFF